MASTSRRSGNKLFGTKSRIINEWFRAPLLCWVLLLCSVFIVYQTKLSKSTELFDLSELERVPAGPTLDPGRQLGSGGCSSQLLRAAYIARRTNAQDCNPLYYSKQHQKSLGSLPRDNEERRREYLGLYG